MSEMSCEKGVQATVHQVKLGESEIVKVRIHLMSGPCQVHKVEQGVQTDYQECYIPLWKFAQQHVQKAIEF